ncbi:hypothetical protein [Agromyces aerolatus]|uniref:hypothetical protein n=1 Tax=Agromyces sp. LY-1074 TaxID=3074080 RepID=UPI00285948F0|nr:MULTISPECIES: hypothetical protein [unclassified Agromyces]MDR5699174.1 hypothetical protein [Agromyces sp. LY-1074]MDR5705469.1 hypothetical protein [Agromyces sp. LY-1358]
MRRLHYTGGHLITADAVCKATLRYARALAEERTSDVVSIPVLGEGGTIASAHLLLGPASQLYSVPVGDAIDEFPASGVVAELERRTHRLQPSRPEWPDEMEDVPSVDDFI